MSEGDYVGDRTLPPLSSVFGPTAQEEPKTASQGWASIGAPDFQAFRPSIPMAVGPVRSLMTQSDPSSSHHSPSWQNRRDLPPMHPPRPCPSEPYRSPSASAGLAPYATNHVAAAPVTSGIPAAQHLYAPSMPLRPEHDPAAKVRPTGIDMLYARSPGRSTSHESRSSNEGSSKPKRIPPQLVSVQHIPGEGECYVFEDGSIMKTVVGGERVNPQWGITKAGKPRKRLAQACVTCREKKIKCEQGDPRDPKCGQCARLNRVCKKPQDIQSSPELEDVAARAGFPNPLPNGVTDMNEPHPRKRTYADMVRENQWPHAIAPGPPPNGSLPTERPAIYTNHFQGSPDRGSPACKRRSRDPWRSWQPSPDVTNSDAIDTSRFHADVDPYQVDPGLTMYLIDAWFRNRACGPHLLVPPECFRDWIRTCNNKSDHDKVVLYAFMALGSVVCRGARYRAISYALVNIAEMAEAQRPGEFSLQLAQTRGALVLYHYAKGNRDRQHDYVAKAVMAVKAMGFHTENGVCKISPGRPCYEYGMGPTQLAECRRTTFWTIYLFDVSC